MGKEAFAIRVVHFIERHRPVIKVNNYEEFVSRLKEQGATRVVGRVLSSLNSVRGDYNDPVLSPPHVYYFAHFIAFLPSERRVFLKEVYDIDTESGYYNVEKNLRTFAEVEERLARLRPEFPNIKTEITGRYRLTPREIDTFHSDMQKRGIKPWSSDNHLAQAQ